MQSLGAALGVFLLCSIVVIIAGTQLARFGDELAEKTGWGTLWVGTILVAVSTSLPELTFNISAVWLENSPGLALGNVFGANMINIFVIALVALIFGVRNVFGGQGRETMILVQAGIGLVALAALAGASGDLKLGPTSAGALLIAALYVWGMRQVYLAGRADAQADATPDGKGSTRKAWIGFGLASLAVIVAARFLAASAESIAEITGIGASFIGVLLVSIVTTLPEGSVTVAAAIRRSYGIAVGNVYGSCAFNVFVIPIADLFQPGTPLLRSMENAHYAAAAAALILMSMGFGIIRSCQTSGMALARVMTPAVPVIYLGALYVVYQLAR
jgi:cation:H+ antiporter